jgi:hypothetical protein
VTKFARQSSLISPPALVICVNLGLFLISALMTGCSRQEESSERADYETNQVAAESMANPDITDLSIVGHWKAERPDGMTVGTMVFFEDGCYVLNEQRMGGPDVTHEGLYRLDATRFPTSIDLSLLDADSTIDGSMETIGSLRFLTADQIAMTMHLSADTSKNFEEDIEETTIILTRIY